MRFNLHARIEIALATVLLLGSCDSGGFKSKFSDSQRDEIADIAGSVAYDTVSEHEKITDLGDRVESLESGLDSLTQTVNGNASAANSNADVMSGNADVLNTALARIDRLESRLGM